MLKVLINHLSFSRVKKVIPRKYFKKRDLVTGTTETLCLSTMKCYGSTEILQNLCRVSLKSYRINPDFQIFYFQIMTANSC